jgi:hypothetical protein
MVRGKKIKIIDELSIPSSNYCVCPTFVSDCVDKKPILISFLFWTALTDKRVHLVKDLIFDQVKSFLQTKSARLKNFNCQKLPLALGATRDILFLSHGELQLHVIWPGVKDICCPKFRKNFNILLQLLKTSEHFFVIICPTIENKDEEINYFELQLFKEEVRLFTKYSNIELYVFDNLDIPNLHEVIFGRRVSETYFKKNNCLRRAGWQQGCHQLVCALKLHSLRLSTGDIKREEGRESEFVVVSR